MLSFNCYHFILSVNREPNNNMPLLQGQREIRQGGPLSPFLLTLVVDVVVFSRVKRCS